MEERTRQDQAVDLRIAGHTYPEIAKRLGYASRQAAHRTVTTSARWRARAANGSVEDGEDRRTGKPLTAAQKQCYDFIRDFIETEGRSPTLAEIARPLSRARSTIHQCVRTLVRKGWLEKHGSGRSGMNGLALVPGPEDVLASQNDRMREALESVLAWAEDEGLDAPCLEAAGELLEELSSDRLERGDCPLISTRQT